MKKNAVSLLTGPSTHLDHLGILSDLLEIPLLITDLSTYELSQELYPQISASYIDFSKLSAHFLASHFDVIMHSGQYMSAELQNMLSLFQEKSMRLIYCPHGNSDKGFSLTKEKHAQQDIVLLYGKHMYEHLKANGGMEKIRQTYFLGNYRYGYYQKHQAFYDSLIEKKIFSHLDPRKKTLLYAPTFSSKEYTSSFFSLCSPLIEKKPSDWNVLIKLHPFLEAQEIAKTWRLLSLYEKEKDVLFIQNFPPIYPLLARCDVYVGDFSSIGYDFLTFDRPMFFIASEKTPSHPRAHFLHQCGIQIPYKDVSSIYSFIENSLEENQKQYSSFRQKVYEYTFEKSAKIENITKALQSLG